MASPSTEMDGLHFQVHVGLFKNGQCAILDHGQGAASEFRCDIRRGLGLGGFVVMFSHSFRRVYMSPKRERRRRARREARRRAEPRIHLLGIGLVLCGIGMFASGLYLAGVIPPRFFPPVKHFWEPTPTALLVGTIGDLVIGMAVIVLGALGIRRRLAKRTLYVVMAFAFLGLVSDMLGGLYAVSAQVTWYITLFTVLFHRKRG